jgi:hypothetical protein
MTAALTPVPKIQFFADDGTPLVGGKLYSYVAGTTTPLATYTTYAGTVANTNPVILDSRGEANVWLTKGVLYKLALYDSDNALIWTVDNISSINDGIFSGPVSGTTGTFSGNVQMASANGSCLAGLRNRVINGNFYADQRNSGAVQTITAAAALAYTVDRFYAYCTGANVTGQRVTGTAPNAYLYCFTGAASVTKIGFAQRIENLNCQDLAGQTATLSIDLSNSLLTTVTWTAWYANTANTFGTLASPTRTLISTGTFTVTSTLTRYSTNITIPAAATTGIEIELSVGAQISGTWNIGNWQLEFGSVATPFEQRPYGIELALCQRYFYAYTCGLSGAGDLGIGYLRSTTSFVTSVKMPVPLRVAPTAISFSGVVGDYTYQAGGTTCAVNGIAAVAYGTDSSSVEFTSATASTIGFGGRVYGSAGARTLYFSGSEL